jgi:prophage regulatory protein
MRLLRLRDVIAITGISRMSIYRYERSGNFPRRRRVGSNTVAWLDEDIAAWMSSRPFITPSKANMEAPGAIRRQ